MNWFQKKCFFVTVGFHLLLVVILLTGSAFRTAQTGPTGGTPVIIYPASSLPAEPQPDLPKPQPPSIAQRTPVTLVDPVKPQKAAPHVVVPNLTGVVRPTPTHPANNSGGAMREPLVDPYKLAIANLKNHFTTGTQMKLPYADAKVDENYAAIVKDKYQTAWTQPDASASDDAIIRVSVTIRSDGAVTSTQILTPSGDASVDASVQRTLNRVTFIAPFSNGAKEKERTFIINFNLKTKRMLG